MAQPEENDGGQRYPGEESKFLPVSSSSDGRLSRLRFAILPGLGARLGLGCMFGGTCWGAGQREGGERAAPGAPLRRHLRAGREGAASRR